MEIIKLGIRHHGIGSARNVSRMLDFVKPDIILIEGPPEGEKILRYASDAEMTPPVALLVYQEDSTDNASFYPFADYSPEWIAIRYGLQHDIPIRFIDMPMTHKFALDNNQHNLEKPSSSDSNVDRMNALANCAGFGTFNDWWDATLESQPTEGEPTIIFEAIENAITALREENDLFISHEDLLREAFMRNMIRTSIKENHDKILIICGAWHIPALKLDGNAKQDKSLTSQLPKVKVSVTWVPWTNNRLSTKSGYGAGIKNPGWYHYKWQYPSDDGSIWITKVADLLRNKTNHPISTADIMECLRLAHQLATLRNHSEIKLHDMNDAAVAVFCGGNETSLKLIEDNLLIGEQIGVIPSSSPKVLLLVDYENRVKKLRLKLQSDEKIIVLDLRNNNDLARSIFFHQLHLLNVPLGKKQQIRSKGTFKEEWLIRWEPEVIVSLIEKSYWGNSVAEAALSFSMAKIKSSADFLVLISILQESLYADLPTLTEYSIQAISEWTTEHTNIEQLLSTIPSLVNVIKYGNVRNTDSVLLSKLSYTLIIRICVNLSNTLTQVDDEQAATLQKSLQDFHFSIRLLNQEPINQLWHKTLLQLKESSSIHPFIHGYCIQLSSLEKLIAPAELEIIVSQALSKNYNTIDSAKWIEGFLKNSVLTLLFDDMIWNVFDHWISSLNDADFKEILPLLRKAFSHFAPNDRIKIVQKVKTKNTSIHIVDAEFDGHQTSNDKINELFTTFIKQLIFD